MKQRREKNKKEKETNNNEILFADDELDRSESNEEKHVLGKKKTSMNIRTEEVG